MRTKELKFEKLEAKERKLLLQALDISFRNMKCHYCDEKVSYKTCGIMPPLGNGKVIITCDSPLCITEYLAYLESWNR